MCCIIPVYTKIARKADNSNGYHKIAYFWQEDDADFQVGTKWIIVQENM